jgi:type VI protein secretion system component VasK
MMTADGTRSGSRAGMERALHIASGSNAARDLVIIALLALILFAVSAAFDLFNRIIEWVYTHDTWQLDELFTVAVYLVGAGVVYGWRRYRELIAQIARRERAEAEQARLIPELENALADVSRLKNLLPLCSSCRRVRDDRGYWSEVEEYVEIHFSTRFDDGLCPECARKLYSAPE